MDSQDLDSLLQSHGEFGSDEESSSSPDVHHHRTVDEILLNHSSSSPSPPSSPSNSSHHYFRRNKEVDVVSTSSSSSSDPILSYPSRVSSSAARSDKYVASAFSEVRKNDNIAKQGIRVLPQLFGGGAMRSNAKPGAALAAAVAAARSIPTPHATAIKLKMRASASTTLQTTAGDDSSLSSSAMASRSSENESDAGADFDGLVISPVLGNYHQEVEEIKLEQLHSVVEKTDSAKDMVLEQSAELANAMTLIGTAEEGGTITVDQDSTSLKFEPHNPSAESETNSALDNINVIQKELSPSLHEKSVLIPEVLHGNDSSVNYEESLLIPVSNVKTAEVEEPTDYENVISEPSQSSDVSSQSDFTDIVENLVSKCDIKSDDFESQKIPHSSPKPLDLAEEIEKKEAYSALHYEEGAAAQPMRLDGLRKDSTVLGYFDVSSNNVITQTISSQGFRRDHGSPQVVAVHFNYIAMGMSKGSIYVLPSKYTVHHVDNMDAKMMLLGLQGDRSLVPVTSMCFNEQGDLLFAGYGDGHYTVWDVQKASALKVLAEHRAPVVHMMYLGKDTQVTRQFNVVSGDSKGVVKLIRFSVVPWLNRISYTKSMKLLDETTSRVVCASPLLYGEGHGGATTSSQGSSTVSSSSIGSMMGGMVDEGVVIFITHQSALVAKVSPDVEVYAQIPKPDDVREGAMPYAAWKCLTLPSGSSYDNGPSETSGKVSLLAIAWDRKVQVAKLVKSKLKVTENWTLESPAIGLAWLDDEMLVVLTLSAHICLYAKDGSLIHRTSFSVDGFRRDDLVSYHLYFTNALGNPEKAYQNSIAVRGANIYILGPEHLVVARLLSWKDRIEVLRKAGDWMGALNMAMALYDGTSHGVIDLPKELDDIRRTIMPYLVELLQSYVSEVFSYMSVACYNQNGDLDQSDEVKEQYARVGGVAVEFCVHIRRTDILFDDIVSKFDEASHKDTFLELLEPYILKDMLGLLPPAIMQALVEHYSKRGWLQRIEQCVLHMDILSLDFNQVVRLCREHRLHGALIYLFNKGLDDFRAPLEELLLVLRNSSKENASSLGYKILVYLKYCFQGLAFPPGRGTLPPTRLPSLRIELTCFLLEASTAPNASGVTSSNRSYPNLFHLLELDTEATLDVLKCAFAEDEIAALTNSQDPANFVMESAESENLIQNIVDILADILDASYFQTGSSDNSNNSIEIWPSKEDVAHIYDFIAYYVAYERANVSKDILGQIFEYLASEVNILHDMSWEIIHIRKRREKQLFSLLEAVPEAHWDVPYLLHLCEKAQFHKVCGYIHAIKNRYVAATESYMKVTDEPIYAFSFIHDMLNQLSNEDLDAFVSAIISCVPDLVKLSREGTYFLIISHLLGRSEYIMSELRRLPETLFLYLKTVIEVHKTGILNLSCLGKVENFDFCTPRKVQQQSTGVQAYLAALSRSTKLVRSNPIHVTDEMTELYFELLCRYERESVLKFLETSESYRVEHCLRLCQEYGIVDAASFLLERVGDVGSALLLILSNLAEKFGMLNAKLQTGFSDTSLDNLNSVMKKKEIAEILDIVHACIGLCQRNSPRLEPDESEGLWFQLLDSFCEPLKDSGKAWADTKREALEATLLSGEFEDKKSSKIKWKLSKSRRGVRMMRKLLSIFIKEIVEGMIGYVRLPKIMLKLLSDNGSQEFGDFKLTILGMLGTYDFEKRILDTAKSLIEDDTYYIMRLLTKGASHGYAPRSVVCCICNSFLDKNSSDSSIQIFSCGHAIHLHCEVQGNGTALRGTLPGCPICTPTKKAQISIGKSVFAKHGLVSKSSSTTHQAHGTPTMYPHDHDSLDNPHASHPAPRFELLNNLQREEKLVQIENMPQLRLAPPAVYHDKVKKRSDILAGESTSCVSISGKPNKDRQVRDVKVKGSSVRFPLKSNIFGKEKISRR